MTHLDELKNDPSAREEQIALAGLAYYRACQKLAKANKLGIFSHGLTVDFKMLVSLDDGASFGDNFTGGPTKSLIEGFYNLFDAGQFETSRHAVAAALNHPTDGWKADAVLSDDMSPEYDENPYCYWLRDEDEDLVVQSDVKGLSFSGLDVNEHRVFDGNRLLHDILSAIEHGKLCLKKQIHESRDVRRVPSLKRKKIVEEIDSPATSQVHPLVKQLVKAKVSAFKNDLSMYFVPNQAMRS